jgi:hypothetical protein
VEPLDPGGPILAECWPRGSTSDSAQYLQIDRASPLGAPGSAAAITQTSRMYAPASMAAITPTAQKRVEQEQLGDLKLYRVPDRTTVAGRQSKQVRLLDRQAIPVSFVYSADLAANQPAASAPASLLLRTQNTAANHLGLPLPSGRIAVFPEIGAGKLLQHESAMRDLAADEEVEINMGDSPGVEVTAQKEKTTIDPARARLLPLVPGARALRSVEVDEVERVEVSNARATEIHFELRLRLPEGGRVVRADHPLGTKNGRPIFRLTVPAGEIATLEYQTEHVAGNVIESAPPW